MQNDTKQTGEKISSFAVNNIPHSEWEKLAILACAGMTDPAAEIQAMRDAIREVRDTLKNTLGYAEQDSIAIHSSVEKLEKYL